MACSNDSSSGALATVDFGAGVKVPLCQACLKRSGLGLDCTGARPQVVPERQMVKENQEPYTEKDIRRLKKKGRWYGP